LETALERSFGCFNAAAFLAPGSLDKTVRFWESATGETLRILKSHSAVSSHEFLSVTAMAAFIAAM
jgi:WD40 repeat protein